MSQAQLLPTASPFQFNDFPIRTQVEGDQLWFAAKDVCAALDITWTGHSLASIPDDWQRVVKLTTLRRGAQGLRVISEPAVYKLAFRSNKPEADAFTNWIASEVVPAIRKTGKYEAKPAPRKKALGRGVTALPESKPVHVFKRMGLTPLEELQMGPNIKRMFEGLDMDKIGPRTMECLMLKARYVAAISEVYSLNRELVQDLGKLMHGVNGPAMTALNKTGCFSEPVADTLYEPRYRLDRINEDYRAAALAALNSNICMAMMLGV